MVTDAPKHSPAQTIHAGCADSAIMAWVALAFSPLAVSAIVLRIAIYGSLSFETAAYAFAMATTLVVAFLALRLRNALRNGIELCAAVNVSTRCIIAAALLMAGMATICLHRPDIDDAIYVPKILHYVAFPNAILDGQVYEIASAKPVFFPRAAAAYYPTAYEFAQAAVAHLAHIDLLTIYYVIAPFMAGILGMFGVLLCLRATGISVDQAACALLVMIPLILLMGETHHAFGNVTLLRAFQSKFAFFLVGLPFFTAASIGYFRRPGKAMWSGLLLLAVAFGGMTTSALVMLPLLALLLAGAWWLVHIRHVRQVGYLVAYGLALFPVIAFALDYRRFAQEWVAYGSPVNAAFPASFQGQFRLVFTSGGAPVFLLSLMLAILICMATARKNAFILIWTGLALLTLLNPVTAPWIIQHVTTENIYWRLFFLLPLPLLWGTAYTRLTDPLLSLGKRRWLAFALCAVLTGLLFVAPTSTLRKGNWTSIGKPGYTLGEIVCDAKALLALAPHGAMLAPVELANTMVVLSATHTQVATRTDFLQNIFQRQDAEYHLRSNAAAFVMGDGGNAQAVITILRRDKPASVVLAKNVQDPLVLKELKALQFHAGGQVDNWVIYVH